MNYPVFRGAHCYSSRVNYVNGGGVIKEDNLDVDTNAILCSLQIAEELTTDLSRTLIWPTVRL